MSLQVRTARLEDGPDAIAILRDSITELCVADHKNDPTRLENWLANKTLETYSVWNKNPERLLKLAFLDDQPAGFAMASSAGEILLNYVSPDARFRGVSRRLLHTLETDLFESGLRSLSLWSTKTAHDFYRARGWSDHGAPETDNGMTSYPMIKLAPGTG